MGRWARVGESKATCNLDHTLLEIIRTQKEQLTRQDEMLREGARQTAQLLRSPVSVARAETHDGLAGGLTEAKQDVADVPRGGLYSVPGLETLDPGGKTALLDFDLTERLGESNDVALSSSDGERHVLDRLGRGVRAELVDHPDYVADGFVGDGRPGLQRCESVVNPVSHCSSPAVGQAPGSSGPDGGAPGALTPGAGDPTVGEPTDIDAGVHLHFGSVSGSVGGAVHGAPPTREELAHFLWSAGLDVLPWQLDFLVRLLSPRRTS